MRKSAQYQRDEDGHGVLDGSAPYACCYATCDRARLPIGASLNVL